MPSNCRHWRASLAARGLSTKVPLRGARRACVCLGIRRTAYRDRLACPHRRWTALPSSEVEYPMHSVGCCCRLATTESERDGRRSSEGDSQTALEHHLILA